MTAKKKKRNIFVRVLLWNPLTILSIITGIISFVLFFGMQGLDAQMMNQEGWMIAVGNISFVLIRYSAIVFIASLVLHAWSIGLRRSVF